MKNFNMMKKLLALTLGAAMLLAVMTGCGKKDTAQEPADDQQQQQEEQQPAEPATLLEQIKAKGKVVVGTEAQYAPYEFKDLDANFAGCDMWLAQQIAARGGQVEFVVAYQRGAPRFTAQEVALAQQAAQDGSVWLLSSSEAVAHLAEALPGQHWGAAHALATHPRIAEAARAAGFGTVRECRPALEDVVASIESAA